MIVFGWEGIGLLLPDIWPDQHVSKRCASKMHSLGAVATLRQFNYFTARPIEILGFNETGQNNLCFNYCQT